MSDLNKSLASDAQSSLKGDSSDEIVVRGTHFELYGAKELAMSMLGEAAHVLLKDPALKTRDGAMTEAWVRDGKSGTLSFEACLEIAGIDEVDGVNLVEAIREQMLENPRKFHAAVKSVMKAVRQEHSYVAQDDVTQLFGQEQEDEDQDVGGEPLAESAASASLAMNYSPVTNSIELWIQGAGEQLDAPPGMRGGGG